MEVVELMRVKVGDKTRNNSNREIERFAKTQMRVKPYLTFLELGAFR